MPAWLSSTYIGGSPTSRRANLFRMRKSPFRSKAASGQSFRKGSFTRIPGQSSRHLRPRKPLQITLGRGRAPLVLPLLLLALASACVASGQTLLCRLSRSRLGKVIEHVGHLKRLCPTHPVKPSATKGDRKYLCSKRTDRVQQGRHALLHEAQCCSERWRPTYKPIPACLRMCLARSYELTKSELQMSQAHVARRRVLRILWTCLCCCKAARSTS